MLYNVAKACADIGVTTTFNDGNLGARAFNTMKYRRYLIKCANILANHKKLVEIRPLVLCTIRTAAPAEMTASFKVNSTGVVTAIQFELGSSIVSLQIKR